ncbi:MAG: hypothetical protein GC162_10365 [Planctomycetes bacterium]|nr:hypothetical protein [Planctomycetota bacterium]
MEAAEALMGTHRITSRIIRPVKHRVYTRRLRQTRRAFMNGEHGSWTFDPALQCDFVRIEAGAGNHVAQLKYIPEDKANATLERMLAIYSTDDQVKVVVDPVNDPGVKQTGPFASGTSGIVLFEGVMHTQNQSIQTGESGGEFLTFTSRAMPYMDNRLYWRQIFGRWMKTGSQVGMIETPDLPAVFNFRGRPNRHGSETIYAQVAQMKQTLTAPLWTHDDDPKAQPWTAREAIASILVERVFGDQYLGFHLPRTIDVDYLVVEQLNMTADQAGKRSDRFHGLDDQLPEVNVQGLGAIDALNKVCDAAGFLMTVECLQDDSTGETGFSDRRYWLSIGRKRTGNVFYFDLAKTGSSFASADSLTRANNVGRYMGIKDSSEIITQVMAVAPCYIEARFDLKPLWSPAQIDTTTPTAEYAQTKKVETDTTGYHAKYVLGGVLNQNYAHVGRLWGIDCVGGFKGYETSTPAYAHDPDGFDFVAALGLNDPDATPVARRTNAGIIEPIKWTKRLRHILTLRSPLARAYGILLWLEVSEDAGENWLRCNADITTLRDFFGIRFNLQNLAAVNNNYLRTKVALTDVSKSWWALILSGDLRFRITCSIIADHAYRADAKSKAGVGTVYPMTQWSSVNMEQTWVAPNTLFNTDEKKWLEIAARVTDGGDELKTGKSLQQIADERQALLRDARFSFHADTAIMNFQQYHLGDRIGGIRGRNISFNTSSSTPPVYPDVVGITYNLGEKDQSIELSLDDHRLVGRR